jgi:TRAP-type mannitol/chloroaromatic compound transport system substrate-binding protein
MFGFFKKKSKYDKLNEEYQKVLKEAFKLSKIDRSKSDAKYAEAEIILKKMGH